MDVLLPSSMQDVPEGYVDIYLMVLNRVRKHSKWA